MADVTESPRLTTIAFVLLIRWNESENNLYTADWLICQR